MKKLIAIALCAVMCLSLISCLTGEADEEGKSETAGEYNGKQTIAYEGAKVTDSIDKYISDNSYLASYSYENDLLGECTVSYKTYAAIISTSDEWSETVSKAGLEYSNDFFGESSLIVIEVKGSSSTDIEGLLHIVAEDSLIIPIIQINEVSGGAHTDDIVYWYVTAEVAKADIEGYELGELEVEWNIVEE
ncbi:MAG: hypothetical protein LUI61_00310 [Firmicutes bacterium]|nr:hypothetical protein [Bacillota bacterium]